jgi:phosphoribosylformylglycinamidine cyclo-ligase
MTTPDEGGLTYSDAGVDIARGEALVERIKPGARASHRPGVLGGLGGFGGLFDLAAAGFRDPILVSGTDGVGTKLLLANELGQHDTIGIDLVAMCANDVLVQGAEPLFFLDYFATGKLDVAIAEAVVNGIAHGCRLAGAALLGGETAEMPGMYAPGHYDLAGFCVGAVERSRLLDGSAVQTGDVLLGLAASGVHSNGFSLVRAILDRNASKLDMPFDGRTLGECLLEPTRIYVASLRPALSRGAIHAMAHITGGGLTGNLPRVLPPGLQAEVNLNAWRLPPLFAWLAAQGRIVQAEMLKTFNCGVGMVLVVAADAAADLKRELSEAGETVFEMGQIAAGPSSIIYQGALRQ